MRNPLAAQLGFGVSVRGADSACNVGTPGRCGREGEAVRFTEPQRPLCTEYWCRAARSANSSPSVRAWPCRRIGTDFAGTLRIQTTVREFLGNWPLYRSYFTHPNLGLPLTTNAVE